MTALPRAIKAIAFASPLLLLGVPPASAQTETVATQDYALAVETVAEGLEHPWALAFVSPDRFLVSERNSGAIRVGTTDGTLSEPIWEADDLFRFEGETSRSQAGLFDIALHPEFEANRLAYISYSRKTDRGAAVAVVRGTVEVDGAGGVSLGNVEDVFVMKEEDQDASGLHFGGRMAFDAANTLYLSIGERRNISRAQDGSDQAGSILRMSDMGTPHPQNVPFPIDEEEGAQQSDPYLFTIGNRNVQALGVNPATGEIWASSHGPQGGDDVALLAAGNNHGWPFITGGLDYSDAPIGVGLEMEGMTSPVHVFGETVAPSGLIFANGSERFAAWNGDMLIGGLVTEGIVRLRTADGGVVQEEKIVLGERVRDLQFGPDGALWAVTDDENGKVLRISSAG